MPVAHPANPTADAEETLRAIVDGTYAVTGQAFFRELVKHLARGLGFRYALVGQLLPGTPETVRVLAAWGGGGIAEGMEYPLAGGPCEHVAGKDFCILTGRLADRFPDDPSLGPLGIECYAGVPLFSSSGAPVGLIALLHDAPCDPPAVAEPILKAFAPRAAAELERQTAYEALRDSERRYHALAESSPVGVFSADVPARCAYANRRACELAGVSQDEVFGDQWARFLHPEDRDRVIEGVQRAGAHGLPWHDEYRFVHPDGRVVWVYGQLAAGPPAPAGTAREYVGTITDITAGKEVEEALRRSERRYAALADSSAVGIWQVRPPEGYTVYINDAMRQMLELAPDEDLSREGYHQFFTPESLEVARVEHAKRARGIKSSYEAELVGRRGRRSNVVISGAPVLGPDGKVESLIGTFTDITDRRRMEQALRDSEARLRLVFEQIPALVWTVDRDLRITTSRGSGLAALGLRQDQAVGTTLYDYLKTADAAHHGIAAHLRALAGGRSTSENEFMGRWFQAHIEPLRDGHGAIVGAVGVALDVTERKRAEEALRAAHDELEARVRERTADLSAANEALRESEQRARESAQREREAAESIRRLMREVDHRVRNNLAGLLALVGATRTGAADVDAFADALEGRLTAMAQVHHLLAEAGWLPVDLGTLVRSLLDTLARLGCTGAAARADGPDVPVSPRQAMPLAMILVEWFTNSCKYGAHSAPGGRVDVAWTVDAAPGGGAGAGRMVRLRWTEAGGPPPRGDASASLGTELVNSFATLELKGRCELRFPPTGANHLLEFPLE